MEDIRMEEYETFSFKTWNSVRAGAEWFLRDSGLFPLTAEREEKSYTVVSRKR
jgi:hypothetical protein